MSSSAVPHYIAPEAPAARCLIPGLLDIQDPDLSNSWRDKHDWTVSELTVEINNNWRVMTSIGWLLGIKNTLTFIAHREGKYITSLFIENKITWKKFWFYPYTDVCKHCILSSFPSPSNKKHNILKIPGLLSKFGILSVLFKCYFRLYTNLKNRQVIKKTVW